MKAARSRSRKLWANWASTRSPKGAENSPAPATRSARKQSPSPTASASRGTSKYGNKRTNGFASKKEAKRYQELLLMEKAGEISHLRTQVPYDIDINGIHVCRYIADFVYHDEAMIGDRRIVEDAKGMRTDVYKLKKKLMLAVHGITIKET